MRIAVLHVLAAAVAGLATGCGGPDPILRASPAEARLVFEDVPRFFTAFDALLAAEDAAGRAEALQRHYLDHATPGLAFFEEEKLGDVADFAARVWEARAYYASIRERALALDGTQLEPEIRAAFTELQRRYPAARFPDVTFVVGRLGSGGTAGWPGLIVGLELFLRVPDSPLEGIPAGALAFLQGPEKLAGVVAHELIHFQQRPSRDGSLLRRALREGAADFVGELLSGQNVNADMYAWAAPREAVLWEEFQRVMHGDDVTGWLYGGSEGDRPADLGYFVGARIVRAYFERTPDETEAIAAILEFEDARAFLAESHYSPPR